MLNAAPLPELERLAGELTLAGDFDAAAFVFDRIEERRACEAENLLELGDEDSGEDSDEGEALPSPIPGVAAESWGEFVERMATADVDTIARSGRLGLFGFSPRRLADIGIVSAVREETRGERTVIVGDFVPPMTEAAFLEDVEAQYDAFAASVEGYAADIAANYADVIGREVDGAAVSLSGLLAVACYAGPGLRSWIENEADRRRFNETTSAFARCNGLF